MYDGGMTFLSLLGFLFFLWPVWLILLLIWLGNRSNKNHVNAQSAAYQPQSTTGQATGDLIDRTQLISALERQLHEAQQHTERSSRIDGLEAALKSIRNFDRQPAWDLPPLNATVSAAAYSQPQALSTQAPQKTDNALTLLYLGAFLFIAAVALFVLLAGLDGITKTFMILLTAGLLYGGGLWLLGLPKNLQTAAPTFLAMGIGTLPFAGLAMNRYLYLDGGLVWLLVSVVALGMSIHAVSVAKAQVVGYFTAFAWLSLLASSLSVVDAPVYMYMWALVAGSILLRLFIEFSTKVPGDDHVPFENTVQTTVPLAIVGSFFHGGTPLELWHVAVTVALSASYYLMMTRYSSEPTRSTYAAAGHLLVIAAAALAVIDVTEGSLPAIGLTLGTFATIQLAAVTSRLFLRLGDTDYRKFLYALTAVLPLITCLFWLEQREWLINGLLIAVIVAVGLLRRSYNNAAALPLIVAILILPFAIGVYQLQPVLPSTAMLALFMLTAVLLWLPRYCMKDQRLNVVWRLGYLSALGLGLLWIMISGSTLEMAWTYLLYAVLAAVISSYERHPHAIAAVPVLLTLSAERFLTGLTTPLVADNMALACFVVGLVSHITSQVTKATIDSQRQIALAYAGIAVLFLAWPFSWFATALHGLFGPTALLLASLAVNLEGRRVKEYTLATKLASVAGMLLAFQLALSQLTNDRIDVLVYTHAWAAYLAWTYLKVRGRGDDQNTQLLKYLGLLVFTVPTALKALDDPAGVYGLLLLAEHVLLAVVGEYLKKRELVKWGVVISILTIVYMLRDFTFINIGFIALLLIGYSIYRLSKNTADNR